MAAEPPLPEELSLRMKCLHVLERDLVERFIRGSGPGGQKINKTSSCVQLRHSPSGIEIKCQHSRSLAANRVKARSLVCDLLEARELERRAQRRSDAEKRRRQKRQPSRRQKKINVANKRRHGSKKRLRGRPGNDE
ncbi:MAG: peptide chain release factor-like protein [Verrucomicrobiaceae bacterium]|nr:peptide chain release factor-like protein [Verrucomicrobiaceae bacterium]